MSWSHAVLTASCALAGGVAGWFAPLWVARLPEPTLPDPAEEDRGEADDAVDDEPKLPYAELAAWSKLRPLSIVLTILVCGLLAWRLGWHPALPALLYLAFAGFVLTYVDLRVRLLPNAIVLPSYPIVLGLLAIGALVSGEWARFGWAVVWGAAIWTLFAAVVLIYPPWMGFGDVKLVGLLGLGVGWFGLTHVVVGVVAGFMLGGVVGLTLLVLRRTTRKSPIPFGPFLVAGFLLAALTGPDLVPWYLGRAG